LRCARPASPEGRAPIASQTRVGLGKSSAHVGARPSGLRKRGSRSSLLSRLGETDLVTSDGQGFSFRFGGEGRCSARTRSTLALTKPRFLRRIRSVLGLPIAVGARQMALATTSDGQRRSGCRVHGSWLGRSRRGFVSRSSKIVWERSSLRVGVRLTNEKGRSEERPWCAVRTRSLLLGWSDGAEALHGAGLLLKASTTVKARSAPGVS
jgi:hypothetical protein